jgi:hypothetical protein
MNWRRRKTAKPWEVVVAAVLELQLLSRREDILLIFITDKRGQGQKYVRHYHHNDRGQSPREKLNYLDGTDRFTHTNKNSLHSERVEKLSWVIKK